MRFAAAALTLIATGPAIAQPADPVIARAKAAMSATLKDPYSAKFDQLTRKVAPNARGEPTEVVCGAVNAKNSYGGYSGSKPFVYLVKLNQAYVVDGVDPVIPPALWKRFCLGQPD